MRILTYNVLGRHGDWPARRAAMRPAVRDKDGTGASIASRWPIRVVRRELLHVTPRVDVTEAWIGSVVLAHVEAPEGTVLLAHFKPSWQFHLAHERELQAVAAARMIEDEVTADPPDHVIVAGDFDSTPDSSMMRFWTGRQSLGDTSVVYRDSWECARGTAAGLTFVPSNPLRAREEIRHEIGRRIDYILVRYDQWGPTLAVDSCDRFLDHPVGDVWASDHLGVTAQLIRQ